MNKMTSLVVFGLVVLALTCLALRALAVGRQVPRYAAYWKQRAQEPSTKEALYYVALGDSAAQGIGAALPEYSYVGQVANRLSTKNSRPVRVINLSVSGAKISDGISDQLPKLDQLGLPKDAVVTVELGANDMRDFEPQKFEQELEKLYSQLPTQTIVGNIPYFGGGIFRGREKNVLKANELVEKIAKKYKLQIADLHHYTKTYDSLRNYGGDFFHPNQRGYRNWADAFWVTLDN